MCGRGGAGGFLLWASPRGNCSLLMCVQCCDIACTCDAACKQEPFKVGSELRVGRAVQPVPGRAGFLGGTAHLAAPYHCSKHRCEPLTCWTCGHSASLHGASMHGVRPRRKMTLRGAGHADKVLACRVQVRQPTHSRSKMARGSDRGRWAQGTLWGVAGMQTCSELSPPPPPTDVTHVRPHTHTHTLTHTLCRLAWAELKVAPPSQPVKDAARPDFRPPRPPASGRSRPSCRSARPMATRRSARCCRR